MCVHMFRQWHVARLTLGWWVPSLGFVLLDRDVTGSSVFDKERRSLQTYVGHARQNCQIRTLFEVDTLAMQAPQSHFSILHSAPPQIPPILIDGGGWFCLLLVDYR